MPNVLDILSLLLTQIEANPELPVYVKDDSGRCGWITGIEDNVDGPTLCVEFS